MRILILTQSLNKGGITTYLLNLCRFLRQEGHDVHVGTPGGECAHSFLSLGCVLFNIAHPKSEFRIKNLISFLKLIAYCRRNAIDIVQANTRVTQALGFWSYWLFNIPYVSVCHGLYKKKKHRMLFPYWGPCSIAVSHFVKQQMVEIAGGRAKNIHVVYHGQELKKVSSDIVRTWYQRLSLPEHTRVVLAVGRLVKYKGHETLIKAIPKILESFSNAIFIIVGDGPEKESLISLTQHLNIAQRVLFFSSEVSVEELYALSHVYVAPNHEPEAFGLTVLEAMMFSKPVVVSDVPALSEITKNYKYAYLVKPASSLQLAESIINVLRSYENLKEQIIGESEEIKNTFSLAAMGRSTVEIYEKALQAFKQGALSQ